MCAVSGEVWAGVSVPQGYVRAGNVSEVLAVARSLK